MATPDQEAIETFMSITGSSEAVALQKLVEHGGNLNEAVNAHFSEGDRNIHETSVAAPQEDLMDIDDPVQVSSHRPPLSLFPSARDLNPFSLLESSFNRGIFDRGLGFNSSSPSVSHPREVREIPIEVKDGTSTESDHSGRAPKIEDVTETSLEHIPESHEAAIIDEGDDDDFPALPTSHSAGRIEPNDGVFGGPSYVTHMRPSAPVVGDSPDYGIEEEMIRAAIEASKRDAEISQPDVLAPQQIQSQSEDPDIAHAVSLSLKTAEQEKALRDLGAEVGPSEPNASNLAKVEEVGTLTSANGRLDEGSSSIHDENEDAEEQPLVRHRGRHTSSSSIDTAKHIAEADLSPPSSPQRQQDIDHPQNNESDFPSDEWGGISSEEHDEAVMLEAAIFGGIPEGTGYRVPYAAHQYMQNGLDRTMGPYARPPRPPSPSLTAQRLIREQQDDEYLASLQADREKELKAQEEAETRQLLEQAAREAAMEEERRKEEEARKKLEEEQEIERQLAAKEASLPQEPTPDDENAVTLLVRMPDGSRRGRRFLKTDRLQFLFDFIDVGRVVRPGTYRLVRPFPRRAFSDGESSLTLNELGLTSKQEALFMELV